MTLQLINKEAIQQIAVMTTVTPATMMTYGMSQDNLYIHTHHIAGTELLYQSLFANVAVHTEYNKTIRHYTVHNAQRKKKHNTKKVKDKKWL